MNRPENAAHAQGAPPCETTVGALGVAEMFAVWAIRLWVTSYRSAGNLLPDLRRGFVLANMGDEAWLDLDEWLTRLLGSARRPIDVRPVAAPFLSVDELGMLHWLAGLQSGTLPQPCASLQAIAVPGRRLALAFDGAGLRFGAAASGGGFASAAPSEFVMQ